MLLSHDGVKYRFVLDNHFFENVLVLPQAEKDKSPLWQLVLKAYRLKEVGPYDSVWTSPAVKKHMKCNYYDDNRKETFAILFDLIVNIDPTINEERLNRSIKLCASKIGVKNYLVTPEPIVMDRLFGPSSFEVIDAEEALKIINDIIDKAQIGGV